jgi:hypothetical protein
VEGYRDVQCGWIEGAAILGPRDGELGMWTIPPGQTSDSGDSLDDTDDLAPMYRCAVPRIQGYCQHELTPKVDDGTIIVQLGPALIQQQQILCGFCVLCWARL